MRHKRPAYVLAASALLLTPVLANAALPTPGPAAITRPALPTSWPAVPVAERLQPYLAGLLAEGGTAPLRVLVSGETTEAATAAAQLAGLTVQQTWASTGIVVAVGLPAQVSAVVGLPGVTYVEGDEALTYQLSSAHDATRSTQALETYTAPDGTRVDGSGISVAVIDSGIDGSHPFFQQDGASKVVANLENVCAALTAPTDTCFVQTEPVTNDTDTNSGGGHGTHVAGIVAGVETTTTSPRVEELRGAAPGAKLVGLSVGAALSIINANAAMQWVVDHQAQPCKPSTDQGGAPDPACPPIRVTNHSYGPAASSGGNTFDPNSATVRIQRMLVAKGVVPVWAAGNDGGDGTSAFTNPPAMDPTPGVLMVASYNDGGTGTRDGSLSTFSSRGNRDIVGSYPDLSAPGDLITSSCRPGLPICATGLDPVDGPGLTDIGTFNTISGTSMATPYVAGVVAQLLQVDPTLTPGQVEDLLEDNAYEFGTGYVADDPARNDDDLTSFDKGHGLVDVAATLAEQLGLGEPGAPLPACTTGDAQLVDPSGDATQVAVTDVPNGPSQADLDVVEGRLSFLDSTAVDGDVLTVTVRLTDVDEAGPTGEYVRIAVERTGDPVIDIVAQRDAVESLFSATSGGDPLDPTVPGTSATLTGSFDPVTDLLTVEISAANYAALVPGAAVANGDELKFGAVLAQRNTGLLTLTADNAIGTCGFVVGQPATEPTPTPTPTETATPTPTPTATGTPEPTPTASETASPTPTASPTKKGNGGGKPSASPSPSCTPKGNGKNCKQ